MSRIGLIELATDLYKDANTLIVSCIGADGYPQTKAVLPGKYREDIKEIYFCTNTSSKFAAAIAQNSKGSVYFYSRKLIWKGCLLTGEMEIIEDLDTKEKYWQSKFKSAYPQQSYTDPDFCLVRFTPKSGRFYACFKSVDFEL